MQTKVLKFEYKNMRYAAVRIIGGIIMAKKEISELKRRAMLAKQRMKMGYWEKMHQDKQKLMEKGGDTFEAQKLVSDMQREKYQRDVSITVSSAQSKEEELYKRVKTMLDGNEFVVNPIARLMDKTTYEGLSGEEKQRYVLELSKKFVELKERYNREKMSNLS